MLQEYEAELDRLREEVTSAVKLAADASKRTEALSKAEKKITEAGAVLRQMHLEVRQAVPANERPQAEQQLQDFLTEVQQWRADIETLRRQALLQLSDNADSEKPTDKAALQKLQKASQQIQHTRMQALEMEDMGHNVADNLRGQNEQLRGMRGNMRLIHGELGIADRVLMRMGFREHARQILFVLVAVAILILVLLVIYLIYFSSPSG
mmetsp:Transcript_18927/g.34185  ORF Transcript_18927/g.34185 Transcript_18927/m.34185 type:complete len:209 (-) Transcript_18927:55-681(-)